MPRPPDPRLERDVYSVSRLNREVRILLEQGIPQVWIEAELSNFARPSSGHWYFSLKDRDAQLRCAMFRQRNMSVRFAPKDGAQVLVRGRVGLYEPRGEYQLIVEHMEEAGLGALRREFERLKDKLAAEGLFATEAKRPLPAVPRRIGVVTSPTGAAIRDILHILARRFPAADVLIYPTQVQGAAAVPEILAAIGRACEVQAGGVPACDVLIVARGGGSLEDLWAFNDERIARAIACVPYASGHGHRPRGRLHDRRFRRGRARADALGRGAAGGTGCTHLAHGPRATGQRFGAAMGRQLRAERLRLDTQQHRLTRADPRIRLQQAAQRLDELEQRLAAPLQLRLARSGQRVQGHRVAPRDGVTGTATRAARAARGGPGATAARGAAATPRPRRRPARRGPAHAACR